MSGQDLKRSHGHLLRIRSQARPIEVLAMRGQVKAQCGIACLAEQSQPVVKSIFIARQRMQGQKRRPAVRARSG